MQKKHSSECKQLHPRKAVASKGTVVNNGTINVLNPDVVPIFKALHIVQSFAIGLKAFRSCLRNAIIAVDFEEGDCVHLI